ncbi:MAG TPA: T9SS type A sorting domain-containing protein [Candidatus Cloacimonetes bacterium]|nr:T9SS type A sorting domain-containing protein [Candidatus Cloacimonadota bacterium]HEX37623.1 T9SS type A sorting domain-containing protein [Candidatus Cloacimonadota bacterium]
MKKYVLLIIGILLIFSSLQASELEITFSFDKPIVRDNEVITDFITIQQIPGEPEIPFYSAKILLPYGQEVVSVQVTHSDWEVIAVETYIDFAPTPQPTSIGEMYPTTQNETIYMSYNPYPQQEVRHLSTETYKGFSIALINVYPIRYIPASGSVEYASNWTLQINTNYDQELADYQSDMLVLNHKAMQTLEQYVDNPQEVLSYAGKQVTNFNRDDLVDPSEPHDYIIITSQNFLPEFNDFKDWKINRGSNAEVYTVEDIYTNYAGTNQAEKIRNFLILAYTTWAATDTPLEYVLLGGDDEIVPGVNFYVQAGGTIGYIPSDLYYGGLDGSWNADGDNHWGEMEDSPDFYPEVAVGRIPGDTSQDFINALNKIKDYTDIPKPALEKACMVGENLNWNPLTWGGDYKDDVATRIPTDNYHFYTLYQRDGTYSGNAVKDAINSGMGIMNHMGHANFGILMGMSPTTPDTFINDEYGFIYTQGCYPAAFDNPTSGSAECVGERLVIAEHGPMAFIGNTRYGWYSPGSIEGTSQQYDRTFFDALFDEDIRALGKANDWSKIALVGSVDNPWMRWCYYELVVFGDPSCELIVTDGEFPYVEVSDIEYNDLSGDNDGILNPGEDIQMVVEVQNMPDWQLAENVILELICENDDIIIQNNTANFGSIAPGATATNYANPFTFTVAEDCGYEAIDFKLQISANQSATYPFNKTYYGTFEVSLVQNNWPIYLGAEVKSSPIVIDFDNDGEQEVVTVDRLGKIYAITPNAETKPGFPIDIEEEVWASLAAGDVDNDGELEIVVATRNGMIYAINSDGSELFSYQGCGQIITTPTLYDVNGDDHLETIVSCIDGMLYVIDYTGNDFGDFPYTTGVPLCSDVSVGDVNQDDVVDLLVGGTDGKLFAINANAQMLDGFPMQTESHIWASPVIFDDQYIAFGNSSDKVYIINGNGVIIADNTISSSVFSPLIAFSRTYNGAFNVAYTTLGGQLAILDANGNTIGNWPNTMTNSSKTSPVAADIDGDGEVEIFAATVDGNIFAYNYDASLLLAFPVQNPTSITSPIALYDVDQDGDYEIIAGTTSGVSMWDYKNAHGSFHPWTMYRGNIQRTGNYADNMTYAVESHHPTQSFVLYQNYPNPFAHSTVISYNPGKYHFEKAKVEIYNIKGQIVQELTFDNDSHSIQWNGRDRAGNKLANGIYLYKLLTENFDSEVKRLLLIK